MPLTQKGINIKSNMVKQYGKEQAERVFYASKNAGKISGVDKAKDSQPGLVTIPSSATTTRKRK